MHLIASKTTFILSTIFHFSIHLSTHPSINSCTYFFYSSPPYTLLSTSSFTPPCIPLSKISIHFSFFFFFLIPPSFHSLLPPSNHLLLLLFDLVFFFMFFCLFSCFIFYFLFFPFFNSNILSFILTFIHLFIHSSIPPFIHAFSFWFQTPSSHILFIN